MHHAHIGGLLEHTVSMVKLADRVGRHYQKIGINRDILIAGTFLHDIGKIKEFVYDSAIEYSDEGRLVNHIIIGIQMLDEKIRALEGFPDELSHLLKHMIISHHGERQFGALEPPKTVEALLLHYIDDMDSKVNAVITFMESEETDEAWTGYHRLLERHFYKGDRKE